MATLEIRDLSVAVEDTAILHDLNLDVDTGRTIALMGPNGSGKSTLAYAIAGHPAYTVTSGRMVFDGNDITDMPADERARAGLFLAMQYPVEIPGVSVTNFLRTAVNARRGEDLPVRAFMTELKAEMAELDVDEGFLRRSINEGFSGGEKKRFEILQMAMMQPRVAVLDETDSGLDVDALRIVSEGVNRLRSDDLGVLIITHYTRILNYITPDEVHVLVNGRLVESGAADLADRLEAEGYEHFTPATT